MGAASGRRASRGVHVRAEGAARASAERGVSPGAHQNDVHHAVLTCGLSVGVRYIEIVFFVFEWSWGVWRMGICAIALFGVPRSKAVYGILYMVVLPGGARASEHRTVVERCVYIHVHILPDAGPGGRGGRARAGARAPSPRCPAAAPRPPLRRSDDARFFTV